MSGNCKTCKHNNGRQVVSKGEEPCFSCLTADEAFLKYESNGELTNADRIRAMTDEEMAELFARVTDCGECPHDRWPGCSVNEESCVKRWLEWLRQGVGE